MVSGPMAEMVVLAWLEAWSLDLELNGEGRLAPFDLFNVEVGGASSVSGAK